jgi:hypothetical protein
VFAADRVIEAMGVGEEHSLPGGAVLPQSSMVKVGSTLQLNVGATAARVRKFRVLPLAFWPKE